jgi:hypothetical protein
MNNNKFFSIPLVTPAIILTIGIIIASGVGAAAFYKSRTLDNALSVTGSAKTAVVSDSVKWSFMFSRRVPVSQLQQGYSGLAEDLAKVNNFLASKGITEAEIDPSTPYVEEQYYDPSYQGVRELVLRQMITVSSTDIQKVVSVADNVESLAGTGVFVSTNSPQYYFSKLAEIRVNLLGEAIKDAKARAEQIAKSNDQSVGSLKSAASGVVQVLPPNSVDISDYGSYDTSSLDKEVTVTVRATFFVD